MRWKGPLFLILLAGLVAAAQAQENVLFSGQISTEGGVTRQGNSAADTYQFSRAMVKAHQEFDNGLSWMLEGEADQQTASVSLPANWLLYPSNNRFQLEADDTTAPLSGSYNMARLDRAYLKWITGPLEVTAGLQSFGESSNNFYSPTHYFDPVPALAWVMDEPLGSEGVNADCFLFDDLSLEGSARWLADGNAEEVFRLIDRGIGITLTPSLALLEGRDGMGLELSGTFPDFQVRFEGVNWVYADNTDLFEWVGAVSTLIDMTKVSLQCLQDATGGALGPWEEGQPGVFYLFASAQRDLTAQWQAEAAGVQPLNGGPFLFWPKISWAFETNWKLRFQAQWRSTTPAYAQDQAGLSVDYSF